MNENSRFSPVRQLVGALLNSKRNIFILAGGALVLVIGVLAIATSFVLNPKPAPTYTRIVYSTSTPQPTSTQTPTVTAVPASPTPTPDVILAGIEALGELDTVQYNLQTVVEKEEVLEQEASFGPFTIKEKRLHLLVVAGGCVKAGVDFEETVRYEINDNRVTVYLSAPRITDYYIDWQSLKPYYIHIDSRVDERTVVQKYNEAVAEAQENLKQAALDSDILAVAQVNAAALVQSLILGLGFSEVTVEFLPPTGDEALELQVTPEPFPTLPSIITVTPGDR